MKGFRTLLILSLGLAVLALPACKNKEESKAQNGVVVIGETQQQSEYHGIVFNKPAYNFCLKTYTEGKVKTLCLEDILREKKVVLLFFGYTHCPDVCPAAMQVLQKAYEKLGEDKEDVAVVFISVDPERDTPKLVSEYAKYFNKNFVGLTGDPKEIKNVAKHYMVFYEKVGGTGKNDYLVNHTANVYLITQDGKIRLIYSPPRQKPNWIAEDIKKILE